MSGRITQLADLVVEVNERNPPDRAEVFSVSERYGIIPQRELFTKQIATSDRSKYRRIQYGDVVFNPYLLWNRAVGVCFYPEGGCVSPAYPVLRPRQSGTERFLHYFFRSKQLTSAVDSIATGSVTRRRTASLEEILRLTFQLPKVESQKEANLLLQTLDDKIELNRRMNATLEAMARALFQSWFVDFDPVRAKLDGRKPDGLDAATVALFPAHFKDSTLGHIPQGWEVGTLGDVTEVQGGFAFKSKDFIDSGFPVVKIKNIRDDHTVDVYDVEYVSVNLASQAKEYQLNDGDVLMSMTGANVAKFGLLVNREIRAVLNQRVARFVPRSYLGRPWFVFCSLLDESVLNQIVSRAEGSAQPNVSATGIKAAKLVKPPEAIVNAFNEAVQPLFTSFLNNIRENRTLATLRDTLLPKLLSGDIRVANVEDEVASV